MPYAVTWHPAAVQELTATWLDADDRNAISQAANAIDEALAKNPQGKGEEFYGDRLFVVAPLAVTFTINDGDRTVQVLQVWHQ